MSTTTIDTYIANGITLGSASYSANLTITNTGTVNAGSANYAVYVPGGVTNFTLTNDGKINNTNGTAIYTNGFGTVLNTGLIDGAGIGTQFDNPTAIFNNSGTIIGGQYGIMVQSGDVLTANNIGTIIGGFSGAVLLSDGGSLFNSGTIIAGPNSEWANDAIYNNSGAFTLAVGAGAIFDGAVKDVAGGGILILAGAAPGTLNMGTSFSGFSQISVGNAGWTLEGDIAELASGETITGFDGGNTLIISDFAAVSDSYVAGTGLVLTNSSGGTETVSLSAAPNPNHPITLSSDGTATTLAIPLVTTISTSLSNTVPLGANGYATNITVTNTGAVETSADDAIYSGPSLYNVTITNQGTVSGRNHAVYILGTGTLLNSGTITNSLLGVSLHEGAVLNSGTIGVLVDINYAGYVSNSSSGTIIGIQLGNKGTVLNSGTISKYGGAGILVDAADYVSNGYSAIIAGTGNFGDGIYFYRGGGTVLNRGTISGSTDAIYNSIGAVTLDVGAGAVFIGAVDDAAGIGVLNLAGTTAGSLNLNGTFTGFSNISFGSAPWTLEGTGAELAAGQTIAGFGLTDELDISDLSFTSPTTLNANSGGTLAITDAAATGGTLDLTFTGIGATQPFYLTSDGHGGTDIALCYLAGTRILTPSGEQPIETLNIGDEVITRFGGIQKIKWLGRQSYAPHFLANNPEKWPVHITKGALDGTLPHRDLFISPGHSMLLGETLILAKNLINGLTIRQDRPDQTIDYIQIEFSHHDCIQAEGAWSETFADAPSLRTQFHNQAEFWALYPDYQTPDQLTLCAPRPEHGPALEAALRPLLPAHAPGPLRGCIDQITTQGIEGWAQDTANPHLPILLEIRLSGRRYATILACDYRADLAPSGIGTGHHAFVCRATLPALYLPHLTIHRATDGAQLHPAKHHQKAA